MRRPLGVSAHAHVSVQAEAQQEAAQQGGVILAVALQTQLESVSDGVSARGLCQFCKSCHTSRSS